MLFLFLGSTLAMLATLLSVEFAANPKDSVIHALTQSARSVAAGLALLALAPLVLGVAAYLFIWLARAIL
jgi:hypothetical protein